MKKSTSKKTSKGSGSAGQSASSGKSSASRESVFSIELVKGFTEFMRTNDLVELDLKNGDSQIRLRRADGSAPAVYAAPASSSASAAAPSASATPTATPVPVRKYHTVTSPFVGTFYRSAGPNQDAFVEEGQTVASGDTLCIIEAMKLMNEIESDSKGRVVKILVANGTPVEFGEALFEIDPV